MNLEEKIEKLVKTFVSKEDDSMFAIELHNKIIELVQQEIALAVEKEQDRIVEIMDKTVVDVIHTQDCEHQRLGCDCGYVVKLTNNETIKHLKQLITKQ